MPGLRLKTVSRIPKSKKRGRVLGVAAVVLILVAWIIGRGKSNAIIEPFLYQTAPKAERVETIGEGLYGAYVQNSPEVLINYLGIGDSSGYGGPLKAAVATDLQGRITVISVASQRESPQWFKRVLDSP